jgi:hypothetical protein
VKPEQLQVLFQFKVKTQLPAVVNTGALDFLKLEIEDVGQLLIHRGMVCFGFEANFRQLFE